MIKKLLSNLLKGRNSPSKTIIIDLNDRIQPIDRGLTYEDPVSEFLKENGLGEVTGGGTYQETTGEIAGCDIHIELTYWGNSRENILRIISKFEELGVPKGSKLIIDHTGEEIRFGKLEGMAIYLDGVNLPDHIYVECDINFLIEQLDKTLNYTGIADRNWQGPETTALYYYGDSFLEMNNKIKELIATYPLCQGCQIKQIA